VFERIWKASENTSSYDRASFVQSDATARIAAEFDLGDNSQSLPRKAFFATVQELTRLAADVVGPLIGKNLNKKFLSRYYSIRSERCALRSQEEHSKCPGHGSIYGFHNLTLTHTDIAECAKNDVDCCYFTFMSIDDSVLPWKDESPWEPYVIDGVKSATDSWLKDVEIPKNNNTRAAELMDKNTQSDLE
jgi:hypothetical protein